MPRSVVRIHPESLLLFNMSLRKSKIPYHKDEYFIDEENNVMWLRGSLSRSWARKHMSDQYGYEVKLATQSYIDELNRGYETY